MIDAVLFDLDGTLCEYRRPGSTVLADAFEAADVAPFFTVEEYYRRIDDHVEGTSTMEAGRERCFAALARDRGVDPAVGRSVARAYCGMRDHSAVDPLDGAFDALDALAGDHHLGLVTNGAPGMQAEKLAALDVADRFDTVVHAGYDPGVPSKPDPTPFRHALRALGVTPDRALHVGNSAASDVAGAKAAGLRAAWLANGHAEDAAPDPAPEYTFSTLRELTPPPWRA